MRWIYLSPHFDDVVLSCGGLVYEQVSSAQPVEIWTVCAGEVSASAPLSEFALSLHARWQTGSEAVRARRFEDDAAGQVLGARMRYWELPDCIYRQLPDGSFVVNGEDDLWQNVNPQEAPVVERLQAWLAEHLAPEDRLVSPMTLGNHVDHHLVRQAAEGLGRDLWYYADFPYVRQHPESLAQQLQPHWAKDCYPISLEGLAAWQRAVAEYSSQISTFWDGIEGMRAEMEAYWRQGGGACLWRNDTFVKKP